MSASVAILGAGLSGVLMAMQLKRANFDDFVIYEKQPDVGGTWLRNTWPGLHCDVPSHLYSYSFEPNPDWSMAYASQPEIQAYIRNCAQKYGLFDHLRFNVCIDNANFDEATGQWTIQTAGAENAPAESITHQFLISATGGLTELAFPQVEGLDSFKGISWHSGAWRHDVDLRGQRVAVVGSAASAVQVVPEVAQHAQQVFVYQRSPNWVMPRNNQSYSAADQQAFKDDDNRRRLARRLYRQSMHMQQAFKKRPAAIAMLRYVGLEHMKSAIDDSELIAHLTPAYDPGCKRIVVSDDYYPALAQQNVELRPYAVDAFTETGLMADGVETEVDIIICCTGYKLGGRADGRPALEVYGRDGKRLIAALAQRPESYRGVAIPGFPNYFTVCGINGVAAYTSLFASAELGAKFIADRVLEVVQKKAKSIEVQAAVTAEYNQLIQAELQQMSWATGDCTNFYRDSTGRVLAFFPGTLGRMRRELADAGNSDFVIESF
ncbi:MAG: NAD(P)/FAD-dependent oxidoreductase [Pseudomonadales bacterium]|nr:NAD(P)/FAD-dependent oxidoreductase [Pseudomonadales bacterium]